MARNTWHPEGYASKVVPYHLHRCNAPGGSEGSGCLGLIDTKGSASEDSCASGRKHINLDSNRWDSFRVPLQVLSLSNISHSAMKKLVHRLRQELDQIRVIQKRMGLQRRIGRTPSSSCETRSCSNGQNGPQAENVQTSSGLSTSQGSKCNPLSKKRLGCDQGAVPESGNHQPLAPSTLNAVLMKQCEALLGRLMSHQFGRIFSSPVDVVKLNIPDYLAIIRHPMDLGTIKKKISSSLYLSPLDFLADVRLTFSNAMTYNRPGHDVHFMAQTLVSFFEVRWKPIERKINANKDKVLPTKSAICGEDGTAKLMAPSKKRKIASTVQEYMPHHDKRIMTVQEKHNLGRELEAVLGEMPMNIVNFLREHSSSGRVIGEDEIEIDIDDLSDETLFTLRKLLDGYLQEKQRKCRKTKPCEMEMPGDSQLRNSSSQLFKENPTGEMAKDTGYKTSKCISWGGSADNLVSNSSCSSESEIDGAKASASSMEKLVTGSNIDKKARADIPLVGDHSFSSLNQCELISRQNKTSVDPEHLQNGENGLSERRAFPAKAIRAALLKNRFADTILKAQEKTLEQGKSGDPERVRRAQEEHEMQQKREKARLQAEARAAEDARTKAEAEATAEAKRKRELEREAAREALQKMEKTVEICENSLFLEDFERLNAVPAEHFLSSVDEVRPEFPQKAMGSFNFRGINPLEQLGLYMKVDEEEEEGELPSSSNPLEQLGCCMKLDGEEEGELPNSSTPPLEQLGLYMRVDEEVEEGEIPLSSSVGIE